MKRFKLFNSFLIMLFFILFSVFSGCSSKDSVTGADGDDDDNGGGAGGDGTTRSAYETLVDFSIAKQIMLYEYVAIMTDDYSVGFMEKDLTYEQIDKLFESIYSLAEYEIEVENALSIIENESAGKIAQVMKVEGLLGSIKDFFSGLSGSGTRSRNRILQIASNISAHDRTIAYNNLRSTLKSSAKNENDFWRQLEDGELDNKAPQIFNDFNHTADSSFGDVANENGLKILKIAHREGAEAVTNGAKVMIEVTKVAAPSTAKGMELVEKADEYRDKANTAFVDPVGFIKDEAKSALAEKIGSYVDVDGAVNGGLISENASTALKAVSDLAFGTDDPTEIASKGIDWGVAKVKKAVKSSNGSDIAIAESGDAGIIPATVIAMGAKDEDIDIVLPKGNWDVKTVKATGKSETVPDVEVQAGKTVEITEPDPDPSYGVTISPSESEAEVGSSVSFSADVTGSVPDGASFEWDFGDGSTQMAVSWNGILSHSYAKAGTYTVTLQIKSSSGAVLAQDTAQAVIKSSDDSAVTAFLHTLKSVDVYFNAAFVGDDGPTTRTIHIDTRDFPGDIVWNGLSFSYQYTEGEINVTISGRFDNTKYRLATLDAVSHETRDFIEYVGGWPMGSVTWEYDKDILVEDLPVEKTNQYGVNFLTTTVQGTNAKKYLGTAKLTENNVDDEEDPPKTYSTVDWDNSNTTPELKVYFFD
ncbi:PKD domain-containing protein [Candidatus Latescibacterota bacterium]